MSDSTSSSDRKRKGSASFDVVLKFVVLLAGIAVIIASLREASTVLAPVVGALFFALIVASPVPWLSTKMPRLVASALVGGLFVASLVGIGFLMPVWIASIRDLLAEHSGEIDDITARLTAFAEQNGLDLSESGFSPESALAASRQAFRLTAGLLSAVVFMGFIIAELVGLPRKLSVAYGEGDRRMKVFNRTASRLTTYFQVKTIASLATGLIAAGACAGVGLPLPGLWGLLAFLLNYAPTVGSIVAAVPPVLLAIITLGWERAVVLGIIYLLINGSIGGVLEPKILGERIGLSPLVILISLVLWGWVWGPIGLLLAVPMTMVVKIVFEEVDELRQIAVLLGPSRHVGAKRPGLKKPPL
ncbi:MAG: AI-2E family transporter [Nannocystaceae bacterium]|nr:AI-2E family transporter [bacterium]